MIKYIESITPPPLPSEDPDPQFLSSSLTKKLTCPICLGIVNRPVQLFCERIICSGCCCKAIQHAYSVKCPCCNDHILSSSTVYPPSPLLLSLLSDLMLSCIRKCGKAVKLQHYEKHLTSNCKSHYEEEMNSPSKMTLQDILRKPATSPATPAELKAAHHLVRRLMNQEEGTSSASITVPTHGQVGDPVHTYDIL